MQIEVADFRQVAVVDGDSTGYLTVNDATGFYVGCQAFLWRTDASQRVIITEIVGTTQVGLRFQADDNEQQYPSYGNRSDLTGWTTYKLTRLNMSKQLARVEKSWVRPLDPI